MLGDIFDVQGGEGGLLRLIAAYCGLLRGVLEIRDSRSYGNACSLCCIEPCSLCCTESFPKKIGVLHFLKKKL